MIAIVAVELIAGLSLYALARSAGPRPDGVALGVIRCCASTMTCDLQTNWPPLQTGIVVTNSSVCSPSSNWSSATQPARPMVARVRGSNERVTLVDRNVMRATMPDLPVACEYL